MTARAWLQARAAVVEDPVEFVLGACSVLPEFYGLSETEAWELVLEVGAGSQPEICNVAESA